MIALLRFARSNAVGLVALVVALSGTAYAATALPRNSVGPVQLRTNAVTSGDIATGGVGPTDLRSAAVNGRSIHDRSVGRVDLADSALAFVDGGMRSNGAGDPIAASGSGEVAARTVVLPRGGRLLVSHDNPAIGRTCPSGGIGKWGLYWDGVPVAGSAINLSTVADARASRLVSVVRTTAGTHAASARWWCSNGGVTTSYVNPDSSWTFVMP